MKMQTKLATAIALSLSTMTAYANLPTVYGALDVSTDYVAAKDKVTGEKANETHVNSNSSFVGLKGDLELTENLSAIYQIDWTIYADGDNTDFANRTRYAGLKHKKFGAIKVGQQDTALKSLSGMVDSFNARAASRLDVDGIMGGDNRLSNAIVYETPNIKAGEGNFKVTGVFTTGEGRGEIRSANGTNYVASKGFGNSLSTSVVYTHPQFLVGVAYDKAIPTVFAPQRTFSLVNSFDREQNVIAAANTIRVVGRAKVTDDLTVQGLYQVSEVEDKQGNNAQAENIDQSQAFLAAVEYNLPQKKEITLKAQYSQNVTDFKNGDKDFEARQAAVGIDYAFNKQVKVYGQYGFQQFEQGSTTDKEVNILGVGMEYKF